MAGAGWIRVPVGDDSARWATRGRSHQVLLVVHNVTSATRLLDILPLFDDDFRVQLLVTCTESSVFRSGVEELLAGTGVPVLPWEQAVETPVSLTVSASFGGQLPDIIGHLVILSHGIGYTKKLPMAGGGGSGGGGPVFGMSPEWLLDEHGVPVADALVLSHPEQYERLRAVCPEAAPPLYSPGTLAGTASSRRARTAIASAGPSVSATANGSSSSTPPGTPSRCSATAAAMTCFRRFSPGWPRSSRPTSTGSRPCCTPTSGTDTVPVRSVPGSTAHGEPGWR